MCSVIHCLPAMKEKALAHLHKASSLLYPSIDIVILSPSTSYLDNHTVGPN